VYIRDQNVSISLDELLLQSGDSIAEDIKQSSITRGDYLFHKNDKVNHLTFVDDGCIKLVHEMCDGQERIIRFVTAGEICGLEGLSSYPYSSTGIVLRNGNIKQIPVSIVVKQMTRNQELNWKIYQYINKLSSHTDFWILNFTTGSVIQRLARFLLYMFVNQISCQIMSYEQIGNVIGTTTESVCRSMKVLEGYKAIHKTGFMRYGINKDLLTEIAYVYEKGIKKYA